MHDHANHGVIQGNIKPLNNVSYTSNTESRKKTSY